MTERDELLRLRVLAEKQKAELVEKNSIIDQQKNMLDKQMIQMDKQVIQIERQRIQIENMTQALLHARKKMFGYSAEMSNQMVGQLSLFETTQELADELLKDQKKVSVPSYTRTPRKAGVREDMLANLPKEVEEYIINPEDTCSQCGEDLKVIGRKLVRTEVEFVPAKLKVVQMIQQIAKCTQCGTDQSDHPNTHFQKAAIPAPVLSHSIATASLVAQVMYQKFVMGMPLARQEKDWYRMGLVLPRANMARWIIRCSEEWLMPIYDRIHEEIIGSSEVLHMDETRIQCNKEPDKKPSSQSFMWVIRSGASEKIQATFFNYSRTRGGNVAKNLLAGYHGYAQNQRKYLETFLEDGRLPSSNNFCEAHIRPFATARRAWLFADTPKGAVASAVPYTLAETAKANELNVYEYLSFLLKKMPDTDFYNQPELLNNYMPWSQELPDECRLNQKHQKCFK